MLKFVFMALFFIHSSQVFAQSEQGAGDFVMLLDPLDEPEFYCLDLAGWGDHLQLDDPLQAHTCKGSNAADQMFEFSGNQLKVSGYDRCVQVAGSSGVTLPGSAVLARGCSDSPLQKISLNSQGKILVGDTGYCLGLGSESTEASGPSHVWRTLAVVDCETADASLSRWQLGLD